LIQARSCRNQSRHARTLGEAASPATDGVSRGTGKLQFTAEG
jgi:hypothetical protein